MTILFDRKVFFKEKNLTIIPDRNNHTFKSANM